MKGLLLALVVLAACSQAGAKPQADLAAGQAGVADANSARADAALPDKVSSEDRLRMEVALAREEAAQLRYLAAQRELQDVKQDIWARYRMSPADRYLRDGSIVRATVNDKAGAGKGK